MKISCLVAAFLLAAGPVVAGGTAEALDSVAGGVPDALACDDPATVELEDCTVIVLGSANSLLGGGLAGGGAALAAAVAVGAVLLIASTSGVSSTN